MMRWLASGLMLLSLTACGAWLEREGGEEAATEQPSAATAVVTPLPSTSPQASGSTGYVGSSGGMTSEIRLASASKASQLGAMPDAKASTATVQTLVDSAAEQESKGNLAGAAATLERALRVEPRNAWVWARLARVRFSQGQYQRAVSLATKSNSLSGSDHSLKGANWELIAQAKQAQGDESGAREAQQKASAIR